MCIFLFAPEPDLCDRRQHATQAPALNTRILQNRSMSRRRLNLSCSSLHFLTKAGESELCRIFSVDPLVGNWTRWRNRTVSSELLIIRVRREVCRPTTEERVPDWSVGSRLASHARVTRAFHVDVGVVRVEAARKLLHAIPILAEQTPSSSPWSSRLVIP